MLGLLRSAKTLGVDVVSQKSESAESLVHLTTAKDVKKPLYKDKSLVAFTNGDWDGKIFNEKSGEYEALKDGQYYMRIAASVGSTRTKQQYTYLPFKIDTTKPRLEILSKEYEGVDFVVTFKAVDNNGGIGLAEDGIGAISTMRIKRPYMTMMTGFKTVFIRIVFLDRLYKTVNLIRLQLVRLVRTLLQLIYL